jgi:RimJ/RimL family protein N-acetyltransferase
MPDMEWLTPREWRTLRDLRLSALRDSPDLFLSSYAKEASFRGWQWRAEFDRGAWHVRTINGAAVGLLGVTHEPDTSPLVRYIEYLWVAPPYRRTGIASGMLATALDYLRATGVRTALLWILDGNEAAMRLYERVGFVRTSLSQPLASRPGRWEEQMMFSLQQDA